MINTFSLVIPSYKQEKTILSDIKYLQKSLSRLPYKTDIIVVIDGEVDKTYEKLKRAKLVNVKILKYSRNQGKGYAVKKGILYAKGDIVGFLDAGRDISRSSIFIALDLMHLHDADIVLGSKLHQDSIVNYPFIRKVLSFGYRTIIKTLFSLEIKDTQVGLKIFKRHVARDVYSRIVVKAFAFDVEVLAVARMLGYKKIYESPIKIKFKQGTITNANFWRISFWTLWDTLAVYYRMNFHNYYRKKR